MIKRFATIVLVGAVILGALIVATFAYLRFTAVPTCSDVSPRTTLPLEATGVESRGIPRRIIFRAQMDLFVNPMRDDASGFPSGRRLRFQGAQQTRAGQQYLIFSSRDVSDVWVLYDVGPDGKLLCKRVESGI
jgi:hypothetical protein